MKVIETNDEVVLLQDTKEVDVLETSRSSVISDQDRFADTFEHTFFSGPPGKSAYQAALDDGFVGTEEEWVHSLSTYGIALDNGFVGTEEEWLESLRLKASQADEGKILTNDGDSTFWATLEEKLHADQIEWDLGEF